MKIRDLFVSLLFPLRCPVCDDIVTPFGEKICLDCMKKLCYITPPTCMRCGKKLDSEEKEFCRDCSNKAHRYVQGRALYEYRSVAPAIYRFKYKNRQEYADFFGEETARYLGDFIRKAAPDGLVPVPLHKKRQRRRGFNQSYLLAQAIGRYTGIPVYDNLLKRVKNTVPLKLLNPEERQNNLKKAFIMVGNDVKLKTIMVIDDIYTTGSTIDEAAAVLMAGGVEKVYFLTLACGAGL